MGPLILLVEDYADAREMYAEFSLQGFRVITADSARGAFLSLEHFERPALILLDLEMPGVTGTEVMRQLRTMPELSGIPIVAFTAHALHWEIIQAIRDGFDDVIPKPCSPDHLVALIMRYLSGPLGAIH